MNALRNFACRFRSIPHLANAKEAMGKALIFVKFGCFLHITNNYLGTIALVYGPSMLPTLNLTGDIVFVERISTRFGAAGVGDVVLARSPQNPKRLLTKRITAMEGDIVTFATDPMKDGGCRTVVVPKGHVWIQGDNALQSNDSRHFGAIPYGLLQGKVVCRVLEEVRERREFERSSKESSLGVSHDRGLYLIKGVWPLDGFGSLV